MNKKIFSLVLSFVLIATGFVIAKPAFADQVFPTGCASGIGSSVTTGLPCNGTTTATQLSVGCPSPMGYSTVTGSPCSGTNVAITYLSGCSSMYGYSTANGAPCNGTAYVTAYPNGCSSVYGYSIISGVPCNGTTIVSIDPNAVPVTVTPGLPTTAGSDNMPFNIALLVFSGMIVSAGFVYLARRTFVTK